MLFFDADLGGGLPCVTSLGKLCPSDAPPQLPWYDGTSILILDEKTSLCTLLHYEEKVAYFGITQLNTILFTETFDTSAEVERGTNMPPNLTGMG